MPLTALIMLVLGSILGGLATPAEAVAPMAQVLIAHDPKDPDTRPQAPPQLVKTAAEAPPVPPRLAFVATPILDGNGIRHG